MDTNRCYKGLYQGAGGKAEQRQWLVDERLDKIIDTLKTEKIEEAVGQVLGEI